MRTEAGPAVAELRDQLAAGERHALARFWAQAEAAGTPLVEDADSAQHRLVTFLWRDDGATERVVVVGGPALWEPIETDLMERLDGTDVWYATYRVGADLACSYQLSPNDCLQPADEVTDWVQREATFRADPLNPRRISWPRNPADPATPPHTTSWLTLPGAATPVRLPEGAERGRTTSHRLTSDTLGNVRTVWVHESTRAPGEPPPGLVVMLDGWVWSQVLPVAEVVDAMRARGDCGPVLVVMVDSLDDATRCRELECHPPFLRFLREELIPWIRARWQVSPEPSANAIVGQSLGGLTAVYAASGAIDDFGLVVSQSGSFWWPRDTQERPTEWLTSRIAPTTRRIRVQLDVGALEGADMVPTNRRMRDALVASGHDVTYAEPYGGHDWFRWSLGHPAVLCAVTGREHYSR